MLIVDAHLDLAYNALNNGRSLTQSAAHIRQTEPPGSRHGQITVTFPELQAGGISLVLVPCLPPPATPHMP